jgi:hypothetical protein
MLLSREAWNEGHTPRTLFSSVEDALPVSQLAWLFLFFGSSWKALGCLLAAFGKVERGLAEVMAG